jgi:hypothetical protein
MAHLLGHSQLTTLVRALSVFEPSLADLYPKLGNFSRAMRKGLRLAPIANEMDGLQGGGGGGSGMQLVCNDVVLAAMGGGGGRGFYLHKGTAEFGAGGGAGLQMYGRQRGGSKNVSKWQRWGSGRKASGDGEDELELVLNVGGGGGGGSDNGTSASLVSGTAADRDRLLPSDWSAFDDDLEDRLRRCWLAGELSLQGGGGAGAGFIDPIDGGFAAMHLGYKFSLQFNTCQSPATACATTRLISDVDGAPSSTPPLPHGSPGNSSTGDALALQERLAQCFSHCPVGVNSHPGGCQCACLKKEMPAIDCGKSEGISQAKEAVA